jgi:hypothetical protein
VASATVAATGRKETTMTLQELIDRAAQLGGWGFDERGFIRRAAGATELATAYFGDSTFDECPVTAVANALLPRDEIPYSTDEWRAAAAYLSFPLEEAQLVVYAADGQPADNPEDTERAAALREVLLERLGLR